MVDRTPPTSLTTCYTAMITDPSNFPYDVRLIRILYENTDMTRHGCAQTAGFLARRDLQEQHRTAERNHLPPPNHRRPHVWLESQELDNVQEAVR